MTAPALFGRGAFRSLQQGAQAKQLFLVCARALSTGRLDSVEEELAGPGSNYTNFGLSSVQQEFQEIARSFACNELLPNAARWEEEGTLPLSVLKTAAVELGVGGVYCRGEVGGSELSRMDAAVIFEALAYGDVSVTAYLTIHNMVANVIDKYGSRDLRQHYLPRIVDMSLLTSYCLTEPSSGSDAASLRTVAKRHGKEWVLTGSKCFISGGGLSDLYLVMARTGAPGPKGISAFLVEKGMKGVSFGKRERKLGWKSQPTCTVMLDEVKVPAGNLVGAEGEGFKIAMRALDGGRVNISACSVGGASYCLDTALRYARERRQFGKAISEFQNTQFRLAEMASRVQSSRMMVYNAAKALDAQHSSATLVAAMAKQHATEHCFAVANDAIQTLGGYGYLADFEVERYMRDLRVHTILEGTNDIMRLVMFRELDKLYAV